MSADVSSGERIRVLLFSPLAGRDPLSGDTSYSEALLADPPGGVLYTTYAQALEEGSVRVLGRKPWRGNLSGRNLRVFVERGLELVLRSLGLMFREPIWHVEIEPGAFDVVHQHLFAVRQIGRRTPVVSSAGLPLGEWYRSRENWSKRRADRAERLERLLADQWDVHVPWLRPTAGAVMTVYSERFRRWVVDNGVPPQQVELRSTALPDLGLGPKRSDGHTLGVIARAFRPKGGDVALQAFRLLRQSDPRWRLLIATSRESARDIRPEAGVEVVVEPTRETVLGEILPRIDVLLAPTHADCGVPYGILEALQAGTAVVTSDLEWLDDRLASPGVRRVEARPESVAAAVHELVEHGLGTAQEGARALWSQTFSMTHLGRQLVDAYRTVMRQSGGDCRHVLVVAPLREVVENPFDGFTVRHRGLIRALSESFEVTLLVLGDDAVGADEVPGVTRVLRAPVPDSPASRAQRLTAAARSALGRTTPQERDLSRLVASVGADVAVTVGPWLHDRYRPVWRALPTVHLFEEELSRMVELAPQSARARQLRRMEWALYARAKARPHTVVAISPPELKHAATRFPYSRRCYLPLTLEPEAWPRYGTLAEGDVVAVVGNFAEERNAEGLTDVLDEMVRRDAGSDGIVIDVISGPGVHPTLERFLGLPWVRHRRVTGPIHEAYRQAWAALVPAWRVTGQKNTILQAWACGVPVVASRACADTVGADDALLAGDDAVALVDLLTELRNQPAERRRLAERGFAVLRGNFDASHQADVFRGLVYEAAQSGVGSATPRYGNRR